MSIRSLCDHTAVVYRAGTSRDAFNGVTESWVALSAPRGPNARPNQAWSGGLIDPGPGQVQSAKRQWFLVPEFDVQERDVVKITEGPEAGKLLFVESVDRCTAGRTLHHLEVNVRIWTGSLA